MENPATKVRDDAGLFNLDSLMKFTNSLPLAFLAAGVSLTVSRGMAQTAEPYKIVNGSQTMGTGGIDYVYADNAGRRLYIPRGNQIMVFDLDTLKSAGAITNTGGHGVAVDPKSHHGFSSSRPVSMFDSQTLEPIKKIEVQGSPDGIMFEPFTDRICVLSHQAPNITLIDPKDGTVTGTIDLGGQPEQGASDGAGHLYVDLEDKDSVAVVDMKTLKVTATYPLGGKARQPAGLGLDAKNHVLFVMCRQPAKCVILDANDGKVLDALDIGTGTDGGGFNPATMEAFSSQRDGTVTIIREKSPTSFEVAQTVETKSGAKTCTLDTKNSRIVVATIERLPTPAGDAAAATPVAGTNQPAGARRGGRGGGGGPGMLDVIAIGR
jgi:DNA-binding beta-propeller fold protein YncE